MILLFLVFLVVLSLLLEYWSIEKAPESISADVRTDRRILEQGEEFSLVYTVTNTGRLPRSYVHISQYIPGSINAEGSRSMRFTDERAFDFRVWIGAGTRREVRIRAVAAKRGRYFVPDFAIVTGDFLGFREMRKAGEGKHYNELVIWPRAITSPDLSQAVGGFLGEVSVRRYLYDDPVLTVGFREYTGREPMKQISWTQSARGRGLMVKKPDYTAMPRAMVLVDTEARDALFDADLVETAFSLARGVLECLEKARTPYAFSMNAKPEGGTTDYRWIPEGSGQKHFEAVMEGLGRAGSQSACSGEEMMAQCLARCGAGSGLLLVTLHRQDPVIAAFIRKAASAGVQLIVLYAEERREPCL